MGSGTPRTPLPRCWGRSGGTAIRASRRRSRWPMWRRRNTGRRWRGWTMCTGTGTWCAPARRSRPMRRRRSRGDGGGELPPQGWVDVMPCRPLFCDGPPWSGAWRGRYSNGTEGRDGGDGKFPGRRRAAPPRCETAGGGRTISERRSPYRACSGVPCKEPAGKRRKNHRQEIGSPLPFPPVGTGDRAVCWARTEHAVVGSCCGAKRVPGGMGC